MTSIRRRLNLTLSTALVLLLGGGLTLLYFGLRETLSEQFDRALMARLHDLDARLARGEAPESPAANAPRHHEPRERQFYAVWDTAGTVVASDWPGGPGRLAIPELHHRPHIWTMRLADGHPGRAAGMQSRWAGPNGPYRLVVGADQDELDEELGAILAGIVLAGVAMVLVTVWLVSRTLRRELRPLDALADAAAAIEARSLDRRFPTEGLPSELQPIATRLNDLLARLQTSFARERRVSADLAHELRTPLAELRLAAETALKWPDARPADMDRDILTIAEHMEALIGQMLRLARSEDGRLPLSAADIDVPALVRDVWQGFATRATERQLRAELDLASMTVRSDPTLLRSILCNLVENAVEYTPLGGTITLVCRRDSAGAARIEISNTVADLTAGDVAQFFERFWRKEAARSDRAHFGLGLAVAQAFSHALGWEIAAGLGEASRLTVTLCERTPGPSSP